MKALDRELLGFKSICQICVKTQGWYCIEQNLNALGA